MGWDGDIPDLVGVTLTNRLGGEEEGVALDVSVGVNHCDERCGGEARKRCR